MYNKLLLDIQTGEEKAWEKLLEDKQYSKLFESYCAKYGGRRNNRTFKCLIQEEIYRLVKDRFKQKEKCDSETQDEFAWSFLKNRLFYVIKDVIRNELKYEKAHIGLEEAINKAKTEPLTLPLENAIMDSRLPSTEKVILILKYCYGYTAKELAKVFNSSTSYISSIEKNTIKRAKRRLG